jgi:RNA polymerase sigma factor (sigma-70 family)
VRRQLWTYPDAVSPTRSEIDPAALRLLDHHGPQILATARRYSSSAADAEDAYQRGLEILLTKAPTTREEELVPWLKTVVKHEAFAIRRQRERAAPTTDDGELRESAGPDAAAHDQAERWERLHMGAEALRRLKPQEVRCLQLKAEGYSYKEICKLTGWTYTKVNRCLTEGRKAFLARVAGIEGGAECDRLEPLLSRLADREAGADELRALRPHLRTCLTCRSRLREFRTAPARVAGLVPPVAIAAAGHGPMRQLLESVLGAAQHKAAALGERAHAAAELASGPKIAAVAASAAAIGGGGATADRITTHQSAQAGERAAEVRRQTHARPAPAAPAPAPPSPAEPPAAATAPPPPTPARPPPAPAALPPRAAAPAPSREFAPAEATAPARAAWSPPGGGEFGP